MKFPEYIRPGDVIGVTAPSDGNGKEINIRRLENGIHNWKEAGYSVLETPDVRKSNNGRSSDATTRGEELNQLILNDQVKYILAARGGEFLCEMLPFVDFEALRNHPKWIQGFSDTTGLTFTITTNLEIATCYANNMGNFGMEKWHKSLKDNQSILEGKSILQESFDLCEAGFSDRVTGLEGYDLTQKVEWRNATGEDKIELSGRLLGGCLDVLLNLCGTRYDKTKEFVNKYQQDKILWYLESCELNSKFLLRGLWELREAGWFDHAAGFVFGRPLIYESSAGVSYEEVVCSVLGKLKVPIITNADIGHKGPQFTMINGAMATIQSADGKGFLKYL